MAGDFLIDAGSITLDGADTTYQPAYRRSRRIGRLFQDPMRGTAPHMTIEENLALAYLRSAKGDQIIIPTQHHPGHQLQQGQRGGVGDAADLL